MDIKYKFLLNKVYVFTSVEGDHLKTASDLYNYHIKFENKNSLQIRSKVELSKLLQQIESKIDYVSGHLFI